MLSTTQSSPTSRKQALIRHGSHFSRTQLLSFALVFGVIGGFILYRSFAASPLVASIEAEQMSLPTSATVINDANASSGKALYLPSNGTTSGSVSFPSPVTSFTLIARGAQCSGAPTFSAKLDSTPLLTNTAVGSNSWAAYTYSPTNPISSGTHSLSISFNNDYSQTTNRKHRRTTICSRDLYLDVSNFYGQAAPPPSAPTVTLSATPASITAGQASTLTWNSTGATSCTASGSWSGSQPTSGSVSTGALNQSSTYNLACTGAGGTASSSAVVIVSAVTPPSPPPSSSGGSCVTGSAYFCESFDSGAWNTNIMSPETSGGSTVVDVQNDATGSSTKLLRLYTPIGGTGPNSSSTMAALYLNPGSNVMGTQSKESWYRADLYLPTDYKPTLGNWNWLTEWHISDGVPQNQSAYPGGGGVSNGLGITTDYGPNYGNPRLWFRVAGGDYTNRTEKSTEDYNTSLPITKGHKYQMLYHYKWSQKNDGSALFEWYVDGKLQWSYAGPNMFLTSSGAPDSVGFGLYNYHLVPGGSLNGSGDWAITTYFDNFSSGPTRASVGG
jgi:hypothetical protein